jgi:hypothetical protein
MLNLRAFVRMVGVGDKENKRGKDKMKVDMEHVFVSPHPFFERH